MTIEEIRLEALKLANARAQACFSADQIVRDALEFEDFMLGKTTERRAAEANASPAIVWIFICG